METADVVVINTCAIREAAEAKVIGRQGHLNRLKAANPSLRVVMTGCSVRESNRAGLKRRYPAVDVFLRPDEEPELVDRLGLASAQAPVGASSQTSALTTVKGLEVSDATHLVRARADAIAGGAVLRRERDLRMAPDHLRLRQDVHLLHRPVQPRSRAEPPVRRDRRRGPGPRRPGLPRGHPSGAERQLLRPRPRPRAAVRDMSSPSAPSAGTRTAPSAQTSPSSSAPSTGCGPPTGRARSRASGS